MVFGITRKQRQGIVLYDKKIINSGFPRPGDGLPDWPVTEVN